MYKFWFPYINGADHRRYVLTTLCLLNSLYNDELCSMVDSLKTGLQISRNGGKLLIKNGDYSGEPVHDVKLVKNGARLEIVGESCSECCWR